MPMPIAEAESGLTFAEDNPWYLLATLHGSSLPAPRREAKNRYAWNRYYSSRLTSDEREVLKGRVPQEELTPLTDDELLEWQRLFRERAGDRGINMPDQNDIVELNNVDFIKSCSFSGFIFFECHFYQSHFNSAADFIGSSFMRFTNFAGTIFTVGVNFKKSIFDGVDFESIASSRGGAFFNDTTYAGHANFSHIKLPETVQFHRAVFNKSADFKGAHIGGFFDFREAKISGWAGFQSAEFGAQVLFTDAEFHAPTDFDGCRFEKSPPQLDGATLHQRTNWRRVIWPQLQGLEL
ncbi:pentapeptide repeat-containing protein, partial [Niveispirillum sp. KHB5.9]|uniref:pentapeptide repeat-containing protein n=1 Tax=Niveispirillum sp. KHB5.9 TaxID=3400269 RepID=UPI003A876F50